MKTHYGIFKAPITHESSVGLLGSLIPLCKGRTNTTIHLAICSGGGDIYVGVGLFNALCALPATLITHNIGSVNSVANLMYLAGDQRLCSPVADFGFHSSGFSVDPSIRVDARLLKEWSEKIRVKNEAMALIVRERTNLSEDAVARLLGDESLNSATWAVENGVAHALSQFTIPDGEHFIAQLG